MFSWLCYASWILDDVCDQCMRGSKFSLCGLVFEQPSLCLKMRCFLVLLLAETVSSTRMEHVDSSMNAENSKNYDGRSNRPQRCSKTCAKTKWDEQTDCCPEGFVCDQDFAKCLVALGSECRGENQTIYDSKTLESRKEFLPNDTCGSNYGGPEEVRCRSEWPHDCCIIGWEGDEPNEQETIQYGPPQGDASKCCSKKVKTYNGVSVCI